MKTPMPKTQNRDPKNNRNSVGVDTSTKHKIDELLKVINANRKGRKAKPNDLIRLAVSKITEQDLSEMRENLTGNFDIFEEEFVKFRKRNKGVSRDEFFGLVYSGKIKLEMLEKRFG